MTPPGELLSIEPANPVIRAEPVQPMIEPVQPIVMSAPVDTALFSQSQSSPIPNGAGAPAQNVLAYPVSDGVDSMQMTSALPEGNVSQPVVTGIGTDNPSLASGSGLPPIDPRTVDLEDRPLDLEDRRVEIQAAPVVVDDTPVAAEDTPAVVEDEPVRLAGLLPRFQNPMSQPQWAGGLPAAEKACRQRLKRLGVTFRDIPAISSGKGCGIPYPVELTKLSGGIEIKPAAKLNCQITEAFAQWVKNELAPAARTRYLSGVRSINQMSSYSCRTMNSRPGAPMSEHARGNAIDVGKITLNNGRAILVRQPGLFAFREKSLLNNIRADSCKYFTTVLGPGSDVHHRDHFHFDLRTRKAGYRHCD